MKFIKQLFCGHHSFTKAGPVFQAGPCTMKVRVKCINCGKEIFMDIHSTKYVQGIEQQGDE